MRAQSQRPGRYGDRLFSQTHAGEARRLAALATTFDPASRRHLAQVGVGAGWRCLDVGAGPGTTAVWLADRVGSDGRVVALDRDVGLLADVDHPSLRVMQGDVTDEDFHPGVYDLVHARFVLMHLPERDSLLRRMQGWLRPGGVLVVSDNADLGTPSSPHEAYRRTLRSLWTFLARTIGTDIDRGRAHPLLFREAGLHGVETAVDLPQVRPGSAMAEFLALTIQQTRHDLADTTDVDDHTIDAALDYLHEQMSWDLSLAMITTWGRRSAEPSPCA